MFRCHLVTNRGRKPTQHLSLAVVDFLILPFFFVQISLGFDGKRQAKLSIFIGKRQAKNQCSDFSG